MLINEGTGRGTVPIDHFPEMIYLGKRYRSSETMRLYGRTILEGDTVGRKAKGVRYQSINTQTRHCRGKGRRRDTVFNQWIIMPPE